ncbi:MAG: response regulator transcription factor [Cyanobacteria bacterium P01_H01_bin.153]
MRILLVEDDNSVATVLKKNLTAEHYAVDVASDGQLGWQMVSAFDYDLIVLDVVLPKLDGIQFCQQLRDHDYHMPVLLVTALASSTEKVAGLDAGADDYITKPFELDELLARVRVLLRRSQTPLLAILEWGRLRLDPNSKEATYGDRLIKLTPKEFRLLELFLRQPTQVFTRGAILDRLWNCGEVPGEDTVTAHMRGLRQKLLTVGAPRDLIRTVYGIGYRLKPAVMEEPPPIDPKAETAIPAIDEKPTSTAQQTPAALAQLWQRVKSQHLKRLALLQKMLQALQHQKLTKDLRQQAAHAAHGLAGALGIFGFKTGSALAGSIEQILAGDRAMSPRCQKQLAQLIHSLAAELNQAIAPSQPPQSGAVAPLLVIIDDHLSLLKEAAQTARNQGLAVQIAIDQAAFQALWPEVTAAYQTALLGDRSASGTPPQTPDVIFLNVPLTQSHSADQRQLAQLINQLPSLLVMVCSPNGNLTSRVKAAQLGSQAFFQAAAATAVVDRILKVRSHRPAATNKIMVVDDDPQALEALQAVLEPAGFQLITLNQPRDFWATLQTASPDLLLLDIEMPRFNGLELCRAVRQAPLWNQLPIIFFTAHGDANTRAAALRAGANDLVEKSLPKTALVDRLFEQTNRMQLQHAIAELTPR